MIRIFLLLSLCLLSSCGALQKLTTGRPKKPEKKDEPNQVNVGTIELVNPDQHFVLIRTLAHLMVPAGTELFSTNNLGQVTKYKVTPERKGSFLAADVVAGNPQKNEMVMFHATSAAPPALSGDKPVRGDIDTVASPSAAPSPFPFPVPNQENAPAPPSPGTPPPAAPSEFLRPVPPVPVQPSPSGQ